MGLLRFIHNCKIRTKLMLIYIFCVLVPMLVTNAVIISAVKNNALKQQEMAMKNMVQRIEYDIKADVNNCISIASHLCIDKTINKFLVKEYTSHLDYYTSYRDVTKNNVFRYYYNSQRINNIMLYADNETIMNGGSFAEIDSIRTNHWYKEFIHSGKDMLLVSYYDEEQKYLSFGNTSRTISLIQDLNYFQHNTIDKLVKIDLRYADLLDKIYKEKIDGEIYICNDEYVLFSNKPEESGRRAFLPKDIVDTKRALYQESFNVVTDTWTIYVMPKEIEIWPMIRASGKMIALLISVNLLLPTIVIMLISQSLTGRISRMGFYFDKVKREEFELMQGNAGDDEIGALIKSYNAMVMKIKELIEVVFKKNAEKQALELARKSAELKALQSQVNPHFMFNTLESIRMRSLLKNENETADIIGELSLILRKSLSWDSDYIFIEEEILFVKQYTNIQKYRFGNKLSFSFYIMPGCEKIKIPKLSILTFVENACVHGMEGISDLGNVSVTVSKDEENLYIEVSDSGCGMSEEKVRYLRQLLEHPDINKLSESKSTGMLNALIRMSLYCDGNMQFEMDSVLNSGTDITLQVQLDKIITKEDNA